MDIVSSKTQALQDIASIDDFLKIAATETVSLFKHLTFELLLEYDVFAPSERERTQVHGPPELLRGLLHSYYKNVYGTRPVTREIQKPLVWLSCGFDRPCLLTAVDRFLPDLEHVVNDVFDHLVEQAPDSGLLDSTYRIDSTHVEASQWNNDT